MKTIENKELGLKYELPEMTQGALETYQKELSERVDGLGKLELAAISGAVVRSAVKAGFLSLDAEVSDMHPSHVDWITARMLEHLAEESKVPGE